MILWLATAFAAGTVLVRSGDTVESLAGNDPLQAAAIRRLNAVGDDEPVIPGNSLGYRVELAITPDFSELVVVEDVSGTVWAPELLMVPFRVEGLWWRVATYDRFGFLGIPSDQRALRFPAGVGP